MKSPSLLLKLKGDIAKKNDNREPAKLKMGGKSSEEGWQDKRARPRGLRALLYIYRSDYVIGAGSSD
jgi:hypothetical protein